MVMKARIIILGLITLVFSSCMEKGKVQVQNKVHNVTLESISYGDVSIYYSLLPGEKSEKVTIWDLRESFPMTHQLDFYMVGDGNRVYLKTKESYELNYDETLLIVITDSTEVINPLLD